MDLSYKQRYSESYIPDAYERLLLDALRGDQQHFVRRCGPGATRDGRMAGRHRCVLRDVCLPGTQPASARLRQPGHRLFARPARLSWRQRRARSLERVSPSACPLDQPGPPCVLARDELRAAWAVFTPLLHAIDAGELAPMPYKAGTRGPSAADELAAQAGFVKTAAYEWKEASTSPRL